MNKPHVHADLIKAWADGARIEKYISDDDIWDTDYYPQWFGHTLYRIKPEHEPDDVRFANLSICSEQVNLLSTLSSIRGSNIKFIFDGQTGKLKAAEVFK